MTDQLPKALRCVITGTRHNTRPDCTFHMAAFAAQQLQRIHKVTFILGDATGVDTMAWEWCQTQPRDRIGWERVRVDPALPSPRRFHERNQRMVNYAPRGDWCLAFPDLDSRGTWDCAKRAFARGLRVHFPLAREGHGPWLLQQTGESP